MKTKMTADWAGSVRLPILKQRSGSNPAHTQTHTQTDTHPLYPLKTPLQFTAKAVSAKKENLFFSPPHHNVKSIRLASLTKSQKKVWEGPSLLCGYLDAIPAEMMKRTPVEGAPLGQAWKGNCQRKGEKKGRKRCCCLAIVSVRFHLQSSLCWPDYTDEPCGMLWQHSQSGTKQGNWCEEKSTPILRWLEITAGFYCPSNACRCLDLLWSWTVWPCPELSTWLLLLIGGAALHWSPEEFPTVVLEPLE